MASTSYFCEQVPKLYNYEEAEARLRQGGEVDANCEAATYGLKK